MKITRVLVRNYRSIQEVDITTSDFNILVGQNNCGKTNFFEAMEFFFNGQKGILPKQLRYKNEPENLVSIEVHFAGVQHGIDNMKDAKKKASLRSAIGDADSVVIRRSCAKPGSRFLIIDGEEKAPPTGFDAALNDFLPRFEYVSTKQYYDAVAKFGKSTPIGVMLADVISEILLDNKDYGDFQQSFNTLFRGPGSAVKKKFEEVGDQVKAHLSKQFAECEEVDFSVGEPAFEDFLKTIEVGVNDGVYTTAEEKGDGMQRALMLAIISTYADYRKNKEENGKTFLFFIDEAELHLHPLAQRRLKDVLYGLSQQGDQVFINTHSSVFIADNYPSQNLFRVEKQEGSTEINPVCDSDKPYLVFELLGGSPADLLLPRNFLIVEGESEFEFFTRVIRRLYPDKPQIQILKTRGDIDQTDRVIDSIEKTLTPLAQSVYNKALVVLVDKPHETKEKGLKDLLHRHKWLKENERFFQLPFRDLEQYYPHNPCATYGNWKKVQEEVDAMKGVKKKQLAKHVGDHITMEQFENDMPVCFRALSECWDKCLS